MAMGIVLAACSGRAAEQPTGTSTSIEPPSTTTAPTTVAPTTSTSLGFERPAIIDVPYVQRVVDEIYRLEGEAARHLYANKVPDAEFNDRLEAILGEPALKDAKSVFGRASADGLRIFADPPGDPVVKIRSIVEFTQTCILARADLDFRPLFKDAERRQPDGLVQLNPGDVLPLNPTGWGVVGAGVLAPGQEGKRAC